MYKYVGESSSGLGWWSPKPQTGVRIPALLPNFWRVILVGTRHSADDITGEPIVYDDRRNWMFKHRNLGIKFLDYKAIGHPNFNQFIAKAGVPRYWAEMIVEPYYPEE